MTTNLHQLPGPSSELLGDAFPPLVLVSLVNQGAPDTLGMLSLPRTYGRNSSTIHLPLLPRKQPWERNSLGTPTTSQHILTLTGTHPAKEAQFPRQPSYSVGPRLPRGQVAPFTYFS